jgi:HK97 family phage prohead protease
VNFTVEERDGVFVAIDNDNPDGDPLVLSREAAAQFRTRARVERAAARIVQVRSALSTPSARKTVSRFQSRCGEFGAVEQRVFPIELERAAKSGDPNASYYIRGHAAVFDRLSLNLGGFQEKIDKGAFTNTLNADPDVHLNWDHDMRYALARTKSSQFLLELREDPRGLHYYAKVAPVSYANDLRVLMEGGVIDQASFAFTVEEDSWEITNMGEQDEQVVRTIHRVGELFDVTVTAQGAYPQTDSTLVRAYALGYAFDTDRIQFELDGSAESEELRSTDTEDNAPSHDEVVAEAEAGNDDNNEEDGAPSHDDQVVGAGQRKRTTESAAKMNDLKLRIRQQVERQQLDLESRE